MAVATYQTRPLATMTIPSYAQQPFVYETKVLGAPVYETRPISPLISSASQAPAVYTTAISTPPVSYSVSSPRPLETSWPRVAAPRLSTASAASVTYPALQQSSSVPPIPASAERGSMYAPIEFKFVKDDEFGAPRETPLPPMREPYFEPAELQMADEFDAKVAAYDQRVRELAAQPITTQNLESQIQGLLDGQESLRYELRHVKLQVEKNTSEIEALRREAQPRQMSMRMAMPMPISLPLPVPAAMQTGTHRSLPAPSEPAGAGGDARVRDNMGFNVNFGSTQDYFSAASTRAADLQQTVQGSLQSVISRWRPSTGQQ